MTGSSVFETLKPRNLETLPSLHFYRHQIPVGGTAGLVVDGDLAILPLAGKAVLADDKQRLVIGSAELHRTGAGVDGQECNRGARAIDADECALGELGRPLVKSGGLGLLSAFLSLLIEFIKWRRLGRALWCARRDAVFADGR